jgi:RNA polymerase sigma-70 factor (ECF subfamily)
LGYGCLGYFRQIVAFSPGPFRVCPILRVSFLLQRDVQFGYMADIIKHARIASAGVAEQLSVSVEVGGEVGEPAADSVAADRVALLVESAVRSDREAFGELYRLFHGKVFRLARFYLDGSAEDAVAETFLRAWVALPRYRKTGAPFLAWLYGIARHVVADERAVLRRVEPRPDLPDRPTELHEDDRLVLAAAIDRLPPPSRRVIELKFLMGLPNSEVAAMIGKTVGAVNAQQWRALRKLRELIGER